MAQARPEWRAPAAEAVGVGRVQGFGFWGFGGLGSRGLGFRLQVQELGFGGLGFGGSGVESFMVGDLGFWGLGLGVQGLGAKVNVQAYGLPKDPISLRFQ